MTAVILRGYDEVHVPGKRLGRLVEHDPRSREFPFLAAAPVPLRTVSHRSYGLPLDQDLPKPLGSCTGNAAAGACNTVPLHKTGGKVLKEPDAVKLYERATVLDSFPGSYPPTDTGSSGLAAAKACKEAGLISSYLHAFGIDQALAALQKQAIIIGIDWLEQFDTPTVDGFLNIGGQVRGGHELCVKGYVAARKPYVVGWNSWGASWGPLGGLWRMFVPTLADLLDRQGDATILVR